MKCKIAFVIYLYPLGVSSMIVNSIKLFADKGIAVDVYMDKTTHDSLPADFGNRNIQIILYDDAHSFIGRLFRFAQRKTGPALLSFYRFIVEQSLRWHVAVPSHLFYIYYLRDYLFSRWLARVSWKNYDYVCPVEAMSLIVSADIKGKLLYYNMELLDWSEDNPIYGKDKIMLKALEHKALQKVYAVAIQNDQRAEQFRKINNYDKKIFILPVASMGDPVRGQDSYFRSKFGIPRNVRMVLYAGNIMPWAKCIEMIDSVRNWPDNVCLVLHTWRQRVFETGYGRDVKEHAKGLPVYFSEDYLAIDELAQCLSSADIALMFYAAIDTNFVEILFSSNKLGEYLKAGLPVVTFDYPELKSFFDAYAIGKTITSMDELPSALSSIIDQYEVYKEKVLLCYQKVFRFEKYFEPLFEELYTAPSGRPKTVN
jgi:glycosyltransferase involved in cell wall biosynthesis